MKLPNSKIEAAADKVAGRYNLNAVQLDVEHKRIMATNCSILAIVPVEVSETDQSGLISLETMTHLRGMQKRAKSVPINVAVNGKVTAEANGEKFEAELATGRFPNVDVVVPKFEGPATITFDLVLLQRLADALGPKENGKQVVSLYIGDPLSAIKVTRSEAPEGTIGVLMPCRP
jgi:DNA polymerase III sliding clamp (beta) subunit (PCNA family)